ncbi:FecR family protein [Bradyrhizobium cenepequi]|uniref:FecR family protein n=1 Tax=Bradyrhizobium cenepequi TaxID=2821403 RepID=UPI001CE2C4B7|nr:FecR domain-containing protein [Bradyrhizobium cenepequi]MCA6109653.1 FecR domain-containing protein [Bradyrhizobium cenepequi]
MDERSVPHEALRRQAKDWVVHLSTGRVTEADLRALERWRAESPLHAQAYAQACQLWGMLGSPLETAAYPADRAATIRIPIIDRRIGRRAFLGGALAASAAAAGVMVVRPPLELWPGLGELAADYRTGTGEQRKIELADRVSIELNTRTSLNVGKRTETADNIELIAGEAAVSAGQRPVVVHAAAGQVAASNAQFTVRSDGAEVRVACLAGMVEVDCRGRMATLRPREQISYAARDLGPIAAVAPEVVAAWRDGLLIFQDEPLAHVIEEVNRYRAGRIILMNATLGERRVSARFKLDRLDAVLIQFQEVFGAKATPLGGGFVVLT